jgi:hypothetical protein
MGRTKQCSKCKQSKPITDFYRDSSRKNKLEYWCKSCSKEYQKEYDKSEKGQQRRKLYRKTDQSKFLQKVWRTSERGKEYHREYSRKRLYGITVEEFNNLIKKQNSICPIGNHKIEDIKQFHVDHDHVTGKIRGLLCGSHNRALGLFHDNINELQCAVQYLSIKETTHGS